VSVSVSASLWDKTHSYYCACDRFLAYACDYNVKCICVCACVCVCVYSSDNAARYTHMCVCM